MGEVGEGKLLPLLFVLEELGDMLKVEKDVVPGDLGEIELGIEESEGTEMGLSFRGREESFDAAAGVI